MLNFINQAGLFGWPMVIIALLNIYLTIKYGLQLSGDEKDKGADINNILFLGIFAMSLGFFSHFLGLFQGLQIYPMLSNEQVAAGYATSLVSAMLGMLIFMVSSLLWFFLRNKQKHALLR